MSDHRGDADKRARDEAGLEAYGLNTAASDALEARLAERRTDVADPAVELHAARMRDVRKFLSADSDAPSDERMEQLLAHALQSRTPGSPAEDQSGTHNSGKAVPLPERGGNHRRSPAWIGVAAAVLVVALAGVAVIRSGTGTSEDNAAPAGVEADTGNATADSADLGAGSADTGVDSADSAAATAGSPTERNDESSAIESPESATEQFADDQDGASFEESNPLEALAGLKFTIVVPIVRP